MRTDYQHGPTPCRACFTGSETIATLGDWRLHNNPGYYGSSSPRILILGFSKGANQNRTAAREHFDKIAFAGARHRLQEILERLDLMPQDRDIDALMTAAETEFGVASLVRCSFCKMKGESCKTSGDVIPSAFTNRDTRKIIETCAERYLTRLPASVRLVILLGTSETYIKKTGELLRRLYSDYRQLNPVSFLAGNALWIYATHPSPGNGHFKSWTDKDGTDKSGKKRILAQAALQEHYQPASLNR